MSCSDCHNLRAYNGELVQRVIEAEAQAKLSNLTATFMFVILTLSSLGHVALLLWGPKL